MKTTRSLLIALALSLTAATATFGASAHTGTWKLDEAKSKFAAGGTKNNTVTYTEEKGDTFMLTVEGVDSRTDADGKKHTEKTYYTKE